MNILICPDSFKGTLTAAQAAVAIEQGVLSVLPQSRPQCMPMADGGYGTIDVIAEAVPHRSIEKTVRGPVGTPVIARFLELDKRTAIVEAAQANGLPLIPERLRNPLFTTSYGVGELILHAANGGYSELLISLGGSGTIDGGMGMAQACGITFLDEQGNEIETRRNEGYAGISLREVAGITMNGLTPTLRETSITILADVTNPLCGAQGAAHVYGPQKGATPDMVRDLDDWLLSYACVLEQATGRAVLDKAGSGAAGGLGAALMAFFNAETVSGIDTVMRITGFEDRVRESDLIVTGEGRIDGQTACGKTIAGIARVTKRHNVPVIAIGGSLSDGHESVMELGVSAIHDASEGKSYSPDELKFSAFELLKIAAKKAIREYIKRG
jgi:glycerate 2-kinase